LYLSQRLSTMPAGVITVESQQFLTGTPP
jgi:hypothetical protein